MELFWSTMAASFFQEEEKVLFIKEIKKKVIPFIDNHFYRIKPIHSLKNFALKTYELRLHVGSKDYRVAFAMEHAKIVIFFVSQTLQKVAFEKEVKKWVNRNKEFMNTITSL